MLVEYFIELVSREMGYPVKKIEPDAVAALQKINWTGNIRELRNVVERLMILSADAITLRDVELHVLPTAAPDHVYLNRLFRQFDSLEEVQAFIAREYRGFQK
jgi:two-component system, NtrC family, nitrogen regulation response regulator NtrX